MSFGLNKKDAFTNNKRIGFSEKEIALNMFFGEKFKEDIPYDKHYLYYPTAIITNYFLPK